MKLVLTDIFEELDSNGDGDSSHLMTISLPKIIDQQSSTVSWVCRGELDYEEFKALLKSKEVLLLLSEHTDINIQDLEDTFQRGSYCRVCKIE